MIICASHYQPDEGNVREVTPLEVLATTQRVHSSDTSHRHLMEPLHRMTRAGKATPCHDCPRLIPSHNEQQWCALTGTW